MLKIHFGGTLYYRHLLIIKYDCDITSHQARRRLQQSAETVSWRCQQTGLVWQGSFWCFNHLTCAFYVGNAGMTHWLTINNNPMPPATHPSLLKRTSKSPFLVKSPLVKSPSAGHVAVLSPSAPRVRWCPWRRRAVAMSQRRWWRGSQLELRLFQW